MSSPTLEFIVTAVAGFAVWYPLWKIADHVLDTVREVLASSRMSRACNTGFHGLCVSVGCQCEHHEWQPGDPGRPPISVPA